MTEGFARIHLKEAQKRLDGVRALATLLRDGKAPRTDVPAEIVEACRQVETHLALAGGALDLAAKAQQPKAEAATPQPKAEANGKPAAPAGGRFGAAKCTDPTCPYCRPAKPLDEPAAPTLIGYAVYGVYDAPTLAPGRHDTGHAKPAPTREQVEALR